MTTAHALPDDTSTAQLALHRTWIARLRDDVAAAARQAHTTPLCAGCREKEARYGFRSESDPAADRPRTLCFSCFRAEMARRQAVADRLSRGWNAEQVGLPLQETLDELSRRRRRAQMAARRALGA
jgi:hypothetical protein